jgi:ABC-type lipoprotein release transport system permease subunit
MLIFKIAFRNIFRQKRRTILTGLTMVGGFVLASVSIGWSDGSYSDIINKFTSSRLGHIQIHYKDYRENPTIYKTIDNYEQVGERISQVKGVEKWAPRLFSAGLVSVKDKSAGAQIIGIDPILEEKATNFGQKIIKGKSFSELHSHEAIIGKGLLKILDADIGDEIVFVSQAADGSIANDVYTIIGSLESGDVISDRMSFYLHLQDAQELLALQNRVQEITIIASSMNIVRELVKKVENTLNNSDLEVAPWQVFAESFYQAMQVDKKGMWIMLFVIIFIVAVGVLNSVLMSVLERRREYGLLKAVGTKPFDIFFLVLYEVNVLALFSIILGAVIGVIINYILSVYGITLPEPMTYGGVEFQKLRSTVNLRCLYLPALTVILAASIISIFPALNAAKTEPAKSMRMH